MVVLLFVIIFLVIVSKVNPKQHIHIQQYYL